MDDMIDSNTSSDIKSIIVDKPIMDINLLEVDPIEPVNDIDEIKSNDLIVFKNKKGDQLSGIVKRTSNQKVYIDVNGQTKIIPFNMVIGIK